MGIQTKTSLWDFAVEFYGDERIKNKCLDLQDIYDANVNVVLWLCWLDVNRIQVERAALVQAQNIIGGINRELLTGLRELRAQLIASSSFTRVQEQLIRKHMLNAELAIEKILLQRLQDLTVRLPITDAEDEYLTLFDYLSGLNIDDSGEVAAYFLEQLRNRFALTSEALIEAVE